MLSPLCSALPALSIPTSNSTAVPHVSEWFEEQLEDDLKWSFAVNRILHAATSKFQDIVLLDTKRFGKALLLDGKLQSAEKDEFIYHESMVHPALLLHHNPKTVFILGGGEGSTARETLKHKSIEKVVMCDIDRDVVNFCRAHLSENQDAFQDEKLHIIFDDAKVGLEGQPEKFDIIISDLADPHEGGPCNHLYTKSFYEEGIKPKLNDNGIFVTQAGPSGILSYNVFSSIYNTVKHVFKYVIAYTAHIPSYADSSGWVLASDHPFKLDVEDLDKRIRERVRGELRYLDGAFIVSSTVINKTIRTAMMNETHVFTEEDARFTHGQGLASHA
ncbi:Thermospermine synthase ACAULIS5 [Cucurbita argyrosperma subsp. argyrosperma]|nr:Thermospermine synthase ACAULIS5 [Cucurbita argyrosperma subsp. argyrosperma]